MKQLISNAFVPAIALASAVLVTVVSAAPDDTAYITNYDDDTVSVFALESGNTLATIAVGNGPQAIAVSPDGERVYVANALSGTVSIIDTSSQNVVATVTVGRAPLSIAISRDGRNVFVANSESGSITVVGAASNTISRTISTLSSPTALAYHPVRDELWIGFNSSSGIRVLSVTEGNVFTSVAETSSWNHPSSGLTFSPSGNFVYSTEACGCCGQFHKLSGNHSDGKIQALETGLYGEGGFALGVSVNPVNGNAYFAQTGHCVSPKRPRVSELGGENRELLLPSEPRHTLISPDGKRLYVVLTKAVQVIDLKTSATLNTVPVGANAQRIAIKVANPSPKLNIGVSEVAICWATITGVAYQVEYRTARLDTLWQSLGKPIVGDGQTNCITDAVQGHPQRLYRVILVK